MKKIKNYVLQTSNLAAILIWLKSCLQMEADNENGNAMHVLKMAFMGNQHSATTAKANETECKIICTRE